MAALGNTVTLSLQPVETSLVTGQEVRLEMTATKVESLSDSTETLTYDPAILEFVRAEEGEWVKPGSTKVMGSEARGVPIAKWPGRVRVQ